ncbi:MAG: hypothetical protein WCI45_04025 [Desulfuromonadales bacterium]
MIRNVLLGVLLSSVLLCSALNCYAENWVKITVDVPNMNLESNYYDSGSVKTRRKTLTWTEKFVLTSLGEKSYTKHISQYPACLDSITKNGNVAYHKLDFEIKKGKFRTVAKRNYTKDNKLLCTDKEMGTEFDKAWYDIEYGGPMYNRHYTLVTKFKLGDI